jgi:hypothetical protein
VELSKVISTAASKSKERKTEKTALGRVSGPTVLAFTWTRLPSAASRS